MYKLIKPYRAGDIEFGVGAKFKYVRQSYGYIFLAFKNIQGRYHGEIGLSFTDLDEYFVEVAEE